MNIVPMVAWVASNVIDKAPAQANIIPTAFLAAYSFVAFGN